MQAWPQSRESREIFGETETTKKAPRRDQSRGLESRLQPLVGTIAAMPSLLCSSQILVGWELGQSIPTVVHTVPELPL